MRGLLIALLVLAAAAVVTSRFVPKVAHLSVAGNSHHSTEHVLALANLRLGDPLLWVNRGSVRALFEDPWVLSATVVRVWPDQVRVLIAERTPLIISGDLALAGDGTVLPGATAAEVARLPRLEGWGTERTAEAIELVRLLEPYEPTVISYSPAGFEIQLSGGTLLTPGAEALRAQWSAFVSHRGGRIAVYPWGVSASDE